MSATAIVAGATGLIGRELTERLLQEDKYEEVITLVRTPLPIQDEKLKQIVTTWERHALEEALRPIMEDAHIYCALGTTIKKAKTREQFRKVDYEYPVLLGKLAKQYRAAQFLIVSSMGADKHSRVFYSRVKGETEDALRSLGLRSLHIFRPSLLLGDRHEFRLGERFGAIVARVITPLLAGKLSVYRPIEARDVAAGMIRAARKESIGIRIYPSDQIYNNSMKNNGKV
ncbi:NAD-dependent epimerase/dehydratase family protein [Paenibacillus sp. GCM10023252]|uniref:NAD-dependent epimerase/dehydratase family protein n=1 Tax=Paenibacillus sp. GCM10023252 TaxID=3252649 RepID=UPI00361AC33C